MAGTYQLLKNNKARLQYMYKSQRYSETVQAKNDKEAQRKLAKFIIGIEDGNILTTNMTYLQFAQFWLDTYVKPDCSPTVYVNYKNYLNNRILPYLARYKLCDINVLILKTLFNDMKTWKTKKGTYIKKETYRKFYNIISGSLQKAFEWEKIPSNPCRKIPLKSLHLEKLNSEIERIKNKDNIKIRSYDINTYQKVIELLDNSNTSFEDKNKVKKIVVETALKTGLCLEELAGLEWERDWNYENSTLSVNLVRVYVKGEGFIEKEPKANSRTRIIKISDSLNSLLLSLRNNYSNSKCIFFDLINFNSLTVWFQRWQKKNEIFPVLTVHELRHTHATLLLNQGAKLKAISKRLGHSSVQITIETYIEYLPEDEDDIIESLNNLEKTRVIFG